MKKAIKVLWSIVVIGILFFFTAIFFVNSDEMIWRMFSIIMPLVGICFWGAIILSVIDYNRSKRD